MFQRGDTVLVRNTGTLVNDKLSDHWEEDTYCVIAQLVPGISVYIVQSNGHVQQKSLHRDNLLPIVQGTEVEAYDTNYCYIGVD